MLIDYLSYLKIVNLFNDMKLPMWYISKWEWKLTLHICHFLKSLWDSSKNIFGTYNPTTYLTLYILTKISFLFLEYRHNLFFKYIVVSMEVKFNKYLQYITY